MKNESIKSHISQEPLLVPNLAIPTSDAALASCSRENLVFLATTLAFYLSKGLCRSDLETLINLINITAETLNAILVQRDIDISDNDVSPII